MIYVAILFAAMAAFLLVATWVAVTYATSWVFIPALAVLSLLFTCIFFYCDNHGKLFS